MPEKRSVWALLVDMIDRPGRALANAAAYPRWRWVLPAALAVVVLGASMAVMAPLLAEKTAQQTQEVMAAQLRQLPPDQAERVQAQMAGLQTPLVVGLTGVVAGLAGLAIGWLLQATLLYFGVLISGGDAEFKQLFATMPWLGIPFVIEQIVQTAYVGLNGRLIANQGLSYLVSSGKPLEDAQNLTYAALGQASLFRLWHVALVFVLLRVVGKLGQGAAFLITVLYLAIMVSTQVGLAALTGVFTPSM